MKSLVVYFSLTGNTRFVAQAAAKTINADILELKLKKSPDNIPGLMKFFWAGKQAFTHEKPELMPLDKNPRDYDFIVFGTPVWAYDFVPAFNTFFAQNNISGKKIAVFCCHGGSKRDTLQHLKKILAGNMIIGEADFVEPLKNDEENNLHKAICWAQDLMKNARG